MLNGLKIKYNISKKTKKKLTKRQNVIILDCNFIRKSTVFGSGDVCTGIGRKNFHEMYRSYSNIILNFRFVFISKCYMLISILVKKFININGMFVIFIHGIKKVNNIGCTHSRSKYCHCFFELIPLKLKIQKMIKQIS